MLCFSIRSIQGDHSGRTQPPVDFKTKVPLWPDQARPGQSGTFDLKSTGRLVLPEWSPCTYHIFYNLYDKECMQYREKRQVKSDFCVEGGPLAADDAEGDGSDELHDEPHEAPRDKLVGELRPQLVLVPDVLLLRHHLRKFRQKLIQGDSTDCSLGFVDIKTQIEL